MIETVLKAYANPVQSRHFETLAQPAVQISQHILIKLKDSLSIKWEMLLVAWTNSAFIYYTSDSAHLWFSGFVE